MAQNSQASGNTKQSAASRSASWHMPMNLPLPQNVLRNHLARMLPLHDYQAQVYRMAEKYPPGFEDGFAPIWEVATALLPARQTTQLRINFQKDFHLLAVMGSSSLAGGFRVQLYDTKKVYWSWANVRRRTVGDPCKPGQRLAGRGVNFATFLGAGFVPGAPTSTGSSPFFLREPHPFTEDDAQALVIIQNQDISGASNQIQVALYGQARRFNWPD
jgi:hypothetical protein